MVIPDPVLDWTDTRPETAGEVYTSAPRALVTTVTRLKRLRFLREPPDRTIRRLQGDPNERISQQECIPSPSCRPERPRETMPSRFWLRIREDDGIGDRFPGLNPPADPTF